MTYLEWFNRHAAKHQAIMERLKNRSDEEVIAYFRWENLSKKEIDFCPLFAKGKKCHPMEDLNCYMCACPNFRFNDQSSLKKSFCAIDSKEGKEIVAGGVVHQDCSGCMVPHKEHYIRIHFDRDWRKMMQECQSV